MDTSIFADRYADENLQTTGDIISTRTNSAERVFKALTNPQILDLVGAYYDDPSVELTWFRDEFAKDDSSFSLKKNEREIRVLAASLLEALIADSNYLAMLAISTGSVAGHRVPKTAPSVVKTAEEAILIAAVEARHFNAVTTKIGFTVTKVDEEIKASASDTSLLPAAVLKLRSESINSSRTIAMQTTNALEELNEQMEMMREESQMLWWSFGGYSRTLNKAFASFDDVRQVAIIAAVDLGDLTTFTHLGPVAAPALLERAIRAVETKRDMDSKDLVAYIDSMSIADLKTLRIFPEKASAKIAPLTAAMHMANQFGHSVWHKKFEEMTGLKATLQIEPLQVATQLYREHLIGQMI